MKQFFITNLRVNYLNTVVIDAQILLKAVLLTRLKYSGCES